MYVAVMLIVLGIVVADACPVVTSVSGSCCKVKANNSFKFSTMWKSGVYSITNFCGEDYCAQGFCDAVSDGGGWLVVQRRQDGSVDFNRTWVEYEEGFGNLDGEFWYGLHPLHCLTNQGQWQLRIDFTFSNGTKSYLFYNYFRIGPASSQYQLNVAEFSGITTDPFHDWHATNGMKFTTKDRDNDLATFRNCAVLSGRGRDGGGWWYRNCALLHLNHQYLHIVMSLNRRWHYSISFTEMKIRPQSCTN